MLILEKLEIRKQWGKLLGGCHGLAEDFLQAAEAHLRRAKVPELWWQRESVLPTLGHPECERQDFLVVYSRQFWLYSSLIGAQDYGTHLSVSWYFTGPTHDSAVFDAPDFRSYTGLTRHAACTAADQVLAEHKADAGSRDRWGPGPILGPR